MSPNTENDSFVARNAMSNVTADGKKNFRTALFGFNRDAVMAYIDRLFEEFSHEEKRLNDNFARAKHLNDALQERLDSVDEQFRAMQQQVASEIAFVGNFHEKDAQSAEKIEQLTAQVNALSVRLKASSDTNIEYTAKLDFANRRAAELQAALNDRSAQLQRLGSDSAAARQAAAQQQETVRALQETVRRLQNEVVTRQSELSALAATKETQYTQTVTELQGRSEALRSEYDGRISQLQQMVASMQTQTSSLQSALEEKTAQLRSVATRYNDAVAEMRKREAYMEQLRSELGEARRKHMEYEFRINSVSGEITRRDIAVSQKDNEILALRQYISELESRLGYNVGYQNGHQSAFEVAYRREQQSPQTPPQSANYGPYGPYGVR